MKNKVEQLLRLDLLDNPVDYEEMLFGMWSRWCESVTGNSVEYQKVLANSKINNWYNCELNKLHVQFIKETTASPNASIELIRECYNDITYKMFSIFPKPLLMEAKKIESTGYMAIHGVKIQTKIFNQN